MSLKIWDGLQEICQSSESDLLRHFSDDGFDIIPVKKDRYYAFQDNDSNVLAVAHMDTVRPAWSKFRFNRRDRKVTSPALDDRLGVFILTKILPMFGVLPDILLTTDEEIGASTASLFNPTKKYNWIFSFDRRGDDVVMYDYETDELCEMMQSNGFDVGFGSFSDICYLDHLEVSGFNFGTGYYNEHTKRCFAMLDIVSNMVSKFIAFYDKFKDTKFDYVYVPWSQRYKGMGAYDDYYYSQYYDTKDEKWHSFGKEEIEDTHDSDYDDNDDWDEWLKDVVTIQEAILFESLHADDLGHDVDYFPVDDRTACLMCYTCDKWVYWND